MRGPIRSVLLAALAACALGALTVGSASAATLKEEKGQPFLAIYGFPGANSFNEAKAETSKETPIGGGLGRNFGFGENILFQAGNGVGEALSIVIENGTEAGLTEKAEESFIGGTLMSNNTGTNNPLSFGIQFSDFQDGTLPGYSDTWDRPWIAEICSPTAEKGKCKVDPLSGTLANEGAEPGEVKIENVAILLGGGQLKAGEGNGSTVVQGTVWGTWENGTATTPACIKLHNPPTGKATLASQNLFVTQSALVAAGVKVGNAVKTIKGKACILSANNNYYLVSPSKTPLIEISN